MPKVIQPADAKWIWVARTGPATTLPPDFYLREVADLATARTVDDIAAAMREYGALASPNQLSGFAPAENTERVQAYRRLIHDGAPDDMELEDLVRVRWLRDIIRRLRDLRAAILLLTDTAVDDTRVRRLARDARTEPSLPARVLEQRFAEGLTDHSPRVQVIPDQPTVIVLGIFGAAAAQAYNDLLRGNHVQLCANEPCRRPFIHQRGRADPREPQYRSTGVKYCSRECARAQAQRELRRRRAAEKRGKA